MRSVLGTLLVSAFVAFGQQSPEMTRAQQDISRLRDLVAAGAMAPARLQEAEATLDDARDADILQRTLYGKLTAQDLTPEQSTEMVQAAKRRFDRQTERIGRIQKLVDAGVLAKGEVTALEEELESRRLTMDLADSRARLLTEIAEMAKREQEMEAAERYTPRVGGKSMEHFDGDGSFRRSELKTIEVAFEKKFNRTLPISADGETAFHKSLGFDHRGRVDVAVNPDQPEGVWLRTYLEANEIPYFAFRSAVPGKASGAHIHIGPGSTRLRAAD
jgi:hypothetical protein